MAGLYAERYCKTHDIAWYSNGPCPDCQTGTAPAMRPSSVAAFAPFFFTGEPAELTLSDDSLTLEPDSRPCGGTWGLGLCPETLTAADTVNGKVTCWRCGFKA